VTPTVAEGQPADTPPAYWSRTVPERRRPPAEAVTTFDEVLLGYEPEDAVAEARRGAGIAFGAATRGCPFGVDIDRLVVALAAGDFVTAATVVSAAHPWGGILGRCCHKFCETAMEGRYPPGVEPLNLRALERAAADHGPWQPTRVDAPPSGKHVAIVGAGSGGLATALGLLRAGHAVTIFDALPDLGGMLIVGYPHFRMPRSVLRRELPIQSPLLELRLGTPIDRAALERLLAEYDAVCLAIGRFRPAAVRIPGDDLAGVYEALDFLQQVTLGTPPPIGDTVAVLGAGYTAQDVARTARRLGARVHVLYRRGPNEMPVSPDSRERFIQMMEREGAPYRFFVSPVRIVGENGRAVAVECQPTRPGPPDASGRPRPEPAAEPPFLLPVTAVIKATGQRPDFGLLPPDVLADQDFVLHADRHTSRRGLFVVGDIAGDVGNDGAFVGGLETAAQINRFLTDPAYVWPTVTPAQHVVRRRPGPSHDLSPGGVP
jgi:NADPH-dependent glutamate synthase beta subunit-like oxidoreductase